MKLLFAILSVSALLPLAALELNIRQFGARGDGTADDTAAFQQALNDLAAKPGATLIIPDGKYLISNKLTAQNLVNVTIAGGNDTQIERASLKYDIIAFADCRNITVKNLVFRSLETTCVNGEVIALTGRKTMTVKAENLEDFAIDGTKTMMQIYTADKMQDHRFHRTTVTEVKKTGARLYDITIDYPYEDKAVEGQKVAFFIRGGRPVMTMARCDDSTFDNVRVINGGDLAWGLRFCNNMTFRNCTIGREKDSPLYVSTGADGIHSKHARRGHLIESCDFSQLSDDNLNFSTTFQNIAKVEGNTATIVGDAMAYQAGDRVALFDPETLSVTQDLKVVKASPAKWGKFEAQIIELDAAPTVKNTLESMGRTEPFRLLFGHKGELPGLIFNREFCHKGSVIRNNRFGNNRARGILLRTSDTLIENNIFYNLRGPAILMASEGMWLECGNIDNVTIKNNTFDRVSRSPILFSSIHYSSKRLPGEMSNRNLTITGNTFTNCGSPAIEGGDTFGLFGNLILLENVSGATVSGNIFKPNSPLAPAAEKVIVNYSQNVTVKDNQEIK